MRREIQASRYDLQVDDDCNLTDRVLMIIILQMLMPNYDDDDLDDDENLCWLPQTWQAMDEAFPP